MLCFNFDDQREIGRVGSYDASTSSICKERSLSHSTVNM